MPKGVKKPRRQSAKTKLVKELKAKLKEAKRAAKEIKSIQKDIRSLQGRKKK